jgi:hypothetical protein
LGENNGLVRWKIKQSAVNLAPLPTNKRQSRDNTSAAVASSISAGRGMMECRQSDRSLIVRCALVSLTFKQPSVLGKVRRR